MPSAKKKNIQYFNTKNSSRYATMHQEKGLQDRPKSAKISHFGQNDQYITT